MYRCLCDSQSGDALQIRQSDQSGEGKVKRTTAGYLYAKSDDGRNHMIFDYSPKGKSEEDRQKAIRGITHELGHSIRLLHEHQRPDASLFIEFQCEKLRGYDQAKKDAQANKHNDFDPAQAIDERMHSICKKQNMAHKYLAVAAQYITTVAVDHMKGRAQYPKQKLSDYGSIMIYGSEYNGEGSLPRPRDKWPLIRKPLTDHRPVYIGGSADAGKAVPSIQDVLRVAALYPATDPRKQKQLKELEEHQ